jgi:GAF domain-containing protein
MAELEFLGALANQLAHRIAARELLEERRHVFSSPISADMDSTIAGCKLPRQRDSSKVESAAATIYVA